MKLKFALWLVILILLLPFRAAANQDTPPQEALLGYNPATGRVVIFEAQAGTANILLDETLDPDNMLMKTWRIGPSDFLAQVRGPDREIDTTLWLSADGLQDVSALFDWEGWEFAPEPIYFEQDKLVMLARNYYPYPIMYIMDLQKQQVETFGAVDYIVPRLSADATKLRFVGLVPDTNDQWDILEYDLASGQTTPLNLLHMTSPTFPLIHRDPYGEHWLWRADRTTPPDLIGLDGSVRTLDFPIPPDNALLLFGMWDDQILAYDINCEVDCAAYVQPVSGTAWTAYPTPMLRDAIIFGWVDNRLVVTDSEHKLYLASPDGPPQFLGYLSEAPSMRLAPGFTWSPDLRYLVYGDDPTLPTTVHLYSVEADAILLSGEAARPTVSATYTAGGITLDLRGETLLYRYADGETFSLPTPAADVRYVGAQLLSDGGVVYGAENHDEDVFQVLYYDPRTSAEPSVLLDAVTLHAFDLMTQR